MEIFENILLYNINKIEVLIERGKTGEDILRRHNSLRYKVVVDVIISHKFIQCKYEIEKQQIRNVLTISLFMSDFVVYVVKN